MDKNNLVINIKDKNEPLNDIPGYEEHIGENILHSNEKCLLCWNCSRGINNNIISIPHDYINGIFYTNGNFCSYNCGLRYIIDNFSGNELWTKVSLLNQYYRMNTDDNKKIIPCPNKKMLKVFGGSLSYEEYHRNKCSIDVFISPILPINNVEYSHENKKNNKTKNNEYRLYRKTPIKNKNDIYDTMGLSVD